MHSPGYLCGGVYFAGLIQAHRQTGVPFEVNEHNAKTEETIKNYMHVLMRSIARRAGTHSKIIHE